MRRLSLGLAAVVAVGAATAAFAATNTYELSATISPRAPGTKARPVPVSLTTSIRIGEEGGRRPAPVRRYEFSYVGLRTNGRVFPTCSAKRINDVGTDSGCPRAALVGRGQTRSLAGADGDPDDKTYSCDLSIRAYNAPKDHLAIYLFGELPNCGAPISRAIDARYVGPQGRRKLVYDVPPELNHVVAGITSATVELSMTFPRRTVARRGRRVGFSELVGGCAGGRRAVSAAFTTEDGTTTTDRTEVRC